MTGDTLTGSCLCGAITFEVHQDRTGVDACHCRMCRTWSGGPLITVRAVKPDMIALEGAEHLSTYRSSEWAERTFCSRCGSNLWFAFLPDNHVSFLAGLFDLPDGYEMREQIFIDEKPDYYDFAQDTPRKTGAEVVAEAKAAGFDLG